MPKLLIDDKDFKAMRENDPKTTVRKHVVKLNTFPIIQEQTTGKESSINGLDFNWAGRKI